jgi:hypothetical protein
MVCITGARQYFPHSWTRISTQPRPEPLSTWYSSSIGYGTTSRKAPCGSCEEDHEVRDQGFCRAVRAKKRKGQGEVAQFILPVSKWKCTVWSDWTSEGLGVGGMPLFGTDHSSLPFAVRLSMWRINVGYYLTYKPSGFETPSAGMAGSPKLFIHSFFQSFGVKLSAASLNAVNVQKLSSPAR